VKIIAAFIAPSGRDDRWVGQAIMVMENGEWLHHVHGEWKVAIEPPAIRKVTHPSFDTLPTLIKLKLYRLGIRSVEELVNFSSDDFSACHNWGRISCLQLQQWADSFNIKLAAGFSQTRANALRNRRL